MTKQSLLKTSAILLVAVSLTACNAHGGGKETGGTLIGAAAGGLLGSQFGRGKGKLAATATGVLLGALIGNNVGRSLDRADRIAAARSTQSALEHTSSGQVSTWQNPDTGHSGTVEPKRTYQTATGRYCREFQQTVTVGGQTERAYGTACRQPDGSWQIADSS